MERTRTPFRGTAQASHKLRPVAVNKPSEWKTLLGPINAALEKKGQPTLNPAIPGLEWEEPFFGKLLVRAENFSVEEVVCTGEGMYGAVKFDGKPRELRVTIFPDAPNGISIIEAWGGDGEVRFCKRYRGIELDVPVFWHHEKKGSLLPSSRQKHMDNVDVVFLAPNGGFLQMQISISVRGGKMWLLIQEQYRGQIVRTLEAKAESVGMLFRHTGGGKVCGVIPLTGEHAGPHGDYLTNFPSAQRIFQLAIQRGAYEALGQTRPATWAPAWPELAEGERRAKREVGVISFYNGAVGFGKIVCLNVHGAVEEVFFRFGAIHEGGQTAVSQGKFPFLERGQQVTFRRYLNDRDNWEASVVSPLSILDAL